MLLAGFHAFSKLFTLIWVVIGFSTHAVVHNFHCSAFYHSILFIFTRLSPILHTHLHHSYDVFSELLFGGCPGRFMGKELFPRPPDASVLSGVRKGHLRYKTHRAATTGHERWRKYDPQSTFLKDSTRVMYCLREVYSKERQTPVGTGRRQVRLDDLFPS